MAQQLFASNMVVIAFAVALMLFDLVSGYLAAWKNKEVQSGKMRDGLFHKLAFVFVIALGFALELAALYVDLGVSVPATAALCVWIILIEANSIWENIIKLNPEAAALPLRDVFEVTSAKANADEESAAKAETAEASEAAAGKERDDD